MSGSELAARDDPAVIAVEDRLFRALAVLRVVVLLNAIGLNLFRRNNFEHPAAGVVAVLLMIAWTAYAVWAYRATARRTTWLLAADLGVAVTAILVSPVIKGEAMRATVPGFWVMGALLAWAIHWHWRGGLMAGVFLSAADLATRTEVTQTNYGNIFLIMIGGPIVGYMCQSLQESAAERASAERAVAAAAERARLARAVHDGVLQVLALVQRRGAEAGGELADLGRIAGEQERALRALIHEQDALTGPSVEGMVDVAAELERLEAEAGPVVSVATPGRAVPVARERARELVAIARACLDNVVRHVGPEASAWVLLEAVGEDLVLTVRDEGTGIADGRLAEAAAEGRLGVAESIRGRARDLGGVATVTTGSFGTEWEVTVPR
ncbi:MAG: DUF5931 domain-containing protein [Nocardioides sp.]